MLQTNKEVLKMAGRRFVIHNVPEKVTDKKRCFMPNPVFF
jgi:hypothetical protein